MMGHKVYYANMNRLSEKIMLARMDGTFVKLLNQFGKVALLSRSSKSLETRVYQQF